MSGLSMLAMLLDSGAGSGTLGTNFTYQPKLSYRHAIINGVDSMAANGSVLVVANSSGVMYSTDAGVNWNRSYSFDTALSTSGYTLQSGVGVACGNGLFVIVNKDACFYSTDGANWTFTPNLSYTDFANGFRVVFANGYFWAVGSTRELAKSTDGVMWLYSPALVNANIYSVVEFKYTGGNFIACQSNGRIAYSSDCVSWTTVTVSSTAATFGTVAVKGVAYNGTTYAIFGNNGTTTVCCATSTDLNTWTYQSGLQTAMTTTNTPAAIAWSGTNFVVVGLYGRIATSPTGVTWTSQANSSTTAIGPASWASVFLNSGTLHVFGTENWASGRGQITSTDNGVTWTYNNNFSRYQTVFGYGGSSTLMSTTAANSLFVLAGSGGRLVTSSDGVNWTFQPGLRATTYGYSHSTAIAYGGSKYVVAGVTYSASGASQTGVACATSSDAVSWTYNTGLQTALSSNGVVNDIAYGPSLFLAVGYVSPASRAATSSDGVTWTQQSSFNTAFGSFQPNAACWNGSKFVVVGASSKCATSPDGVTWTAQTGLATATGGSNMNAICWDGTKFITVGESGKCATSPDGVTWTNQTGLSSVIGSTSFIHAQGICWTGSLLVCVGYNSTTTTVLICATSPDGITWTNKTLPTVPFSSVTSLPRASYLNGVVSMIGPDGVAFTSP